MLTDNQAKEQLSIAYVKAIAAVNNFSCDITGTDMDSIDVTIRCNGNLAANSIIRSPEIQIQLKATENLTPNGSGMLPFPLPIKNYNDLRGNTLTPRLLVVLSLPANRANWLTHSINDLVLRNCSFWVNLKGQPESTNQTNVTVYLPYVQTFSPPTLNDLMIKVSRQIPL
nr:DUF4365 domain-containing protein [uncultured Chitinophaga sp.]